MYGMGASFVKSKMVSAICLLPHFRVIYDIVFFQGNNNSLDSGGGGRTQSNVFKFSSEQADSGNWKHNQGLQKNLPE